MRPEGERPTASIPTGLNPSRPSLGGCRRWSSPSSSSSRDWPVRDGSGRPRNAGGEFGLLADRRRRLERPGDHSAGFVRLRRRSAAVRAHPQRVGPARWGRGNPDRLDRVRHPAAGSAGGDVGRLGDAGVSGHLGRARIQCRLRWGIEPGRDGPAQPDLSGRPRRRTAGRLRTGRADIFEPGVRELPADPHPGDAWSSTGTAGPG